MIRAKVKKVDESTRSCAAVATFVRVERSNAMATPLSLIILILFFFFN
jgi:hypothetical protein